MFSLSRAFRLGNSFLRSSKDEDALQQLMLSAFAASKAFEMKPRTAYRKQKAPPHPPKVRSFDNIEEDDPVWVHGFHCENTSFIRKGMYGKRFEACKKAALRDYSKLGIEDISPMEEHLRYCYKRFAASYARYIRGSMTHEDYNPIRTIELQRCLDACAQVPMIDVKDCVGYSQVVEQFEDILHGKVLQNPWVKEKNKEVTVVDKEDAASAVDHASSSGSGKHG